MAHWVTLYGCSLNLIAVLTTSPDGNIGVLKRYVISDIVRWTLIASTVI